MSVLLLTALIFNVKGEAQVKWQEEERKKDSQGQDYTDYIDYTSQETYYENQYYLYGSANGRYSTFIAFYFVIIVCFYKY